MRMVQRAVEEVRIMRPGYLLLLMCYDYFFLEHMRLNSTSFSLILSSLWSSAAYGIHIFMICYKFYFAQLLNSYGMKSLHGCCAKQDVNPHGLSWLFLHVACCSSQIESLHGLPQPCHFGLLFRMGDKSIRGTMVFRSCMSRGRTRYGYKVHHDDGLKRSGGLVQFSVRDIDEEILNIGSFYEAFCDNVFHRHR